MLIDRLLFSDTVPKLMRKALDFSAGRQLLITNNISNVDTPGFKAHDVNFESQVRGVMKRDDQLQLRTTDEKHFGPTKPALKRLSPQPFEEPDAGKSNGNNVDIDKEMAKLAENQIMYSALAQLMSKRASTIKSAVTELPQQ